MHQEMIPVASMSAAMEKEGDNGKEIVGMYVAVRGLLFKRPGIHGEGSAKETRALILECIIGVIKESERG